MEPQVTEFYVRTHKPRPDFRLLSCFLWRENHNIDSDGNCDYPSDREWTELTLINYAENGVRLDIDRALEEPLTLRVDSEDPRLALVAAFFIATYCDGVMAEDLESTYHPASAFRSWLADFDLGAANERVCRSPYLR